MLLTISRRCVSASLKGNYRLPYSPPPNRSRHPFFRRHLHLIPKQLTEPAFKTSYRHQRHLLRPIEIGKQVNIRPRVRLVASHRTKHAQVHQPRRLKLGCMLTKNLQNALPLHAVSPVLILAPPLALCKH